MADGDIFDDGPLPIISESMQSAYNALVSAEGRDYLSRWCERGDATHLASLMASVMAPAGRIEVPSSLKVWLYEADIIQADEHPEACDECGSFNLNPYYVSREEKFKVYIPKNCSDVEKFFSIFKFIYDISYVLVEYHWPLFLMEEEKLAVTCGLLFRVLVENNLLVGVQEKDLSILKMKASALVDELVE